MIALPVYTCTLTVRYDHLDWLSCRWRLVAGDVRQFHPGNHGHSRLAQQVHGRLQQTARQEVSPEPEIIDGGGHISVADVMAACVVSRVLVGNSGTFRASIVSWFETIRILCRAEIM